MYEYECEHTISCLGYLILCFVDFYLKEDAAERFEKMQHEILANDADSVPFNTARLKNDRKVWHSKIFLLTYKAVNH